MFLSSLLHIVLPMFYKLLPFDANKTKTCAQYAFAVTWGSCFQPFVTAFKQK